MDNTQVEQELEELESRLERLRALYEQYFLGMEKLEPSVLRKEVDRRFWTLRREQVRNTGLRFKFQMLIQRYNTYQQYWTRVVREIESGTYRRDIIKVAKRFGEKDALTILGRKRADQYKRLAANQTEMRDKRRKASGAADESAAAAGEPPRDDIDEGPVSLAPDDVELMDDDDDDAMVTPPRRLPPVREQAEPDMEWLLQAATVGVTTWQERAPNKAAPPPPEEAASTATRRGAPPPTRPPPPKPADAMRSGRIGPASIRPNAKATPASIRPEGRATPASIRPEAKAAPGSIRPEGKTTPASIRPNAKAAPAVPARSAGKSRVAELAAQMRAKKVAIAKPTGDDLELDRLFDPPSPAKPAATPAARPPSTPAARPPSTPAARPPSTRPARSPSEPSLRRPEVPLRRISTRPPPKPPTPSDGPPSRVKPAPSLGGPPPATRPATSPARPALSLPSPPTTPPTARPAPQPVASLSQPVAPRPLPTPSASPQAAREDLSEKKMRDIYARYVGAKRAANESTAGITFDKLAASLRAQADKLKTSHPSRSVDFEVVTKDGKTALRPIVK